MPPPMGVRNPDIVQERLKHLHDTKRLSFRKIADLDEYSGIPAGTLCSIAKTGHVPKKWRKKLGLPPLVKVEACANCGEVHLRKTCPHRRNGRTRRPRPSYKRRWQAALMLLAIVLKEGNND